MRTPNIPEATWHAALEDLSGVMADFIDRHKGRGFATPDLVIMFAHCLGVSAVISSRAAGLPGLTPRNIAGMTEDFCLALQHVYDVRDQIPE